jgi:hypothetical protein
MKREPWPYYPTVKVTGIVLLIPGVAASVEQLRTLDDHPVVTLTGALVGAGLVYGFGCGAAALVVFLRNLIFTRGAPVDEAAPAA